MRSMRMIVLQRCDCSPATNDTEQPPCESRVLFSFVASKVDQVPEPYLCSASTTKPE